MIIIDEVMVACAFILIYIQQNSNIKLMVSRSYNAVEKPHTSTQLHKQTNTHTHTHKFKCKNKHFEGG